jgi:trigger factor
MGAVIILLTLTSCSKEPYEYDLKGFITVPEDISDIVITDAQIKETVEKQIQTVRKNKAKLETVTVRGAIYGDVAKVSIKCYRYDPEKKLLQYLSDDNASIVLGQGKYPSELENAIIRRVAGEKFTILANLPITFTALDLAGRQVMYECEIKQISTYVLPEYNDDFVKSISSYETTAEYEEYLYIKMKEELVFQALLEKSTVTHYPVAEVQAYINSFVKYHTEKADELNLNLEEYAAKKFFVNMTDFHLKADAYAKELVKKEMVLYSVVRKNNIELTDDEYTAGAKAYADQYGLKSVSQLEGRFGTAYVQQTVLLDKVMAYLSEQITVSEIPTP